MFGRIGTVALNDSGSALTISISGWPIASMASSSSALL
jgi:hypothetical protein